MIGIETAIGHQNFYPDGGGFQTNCIEHSLKAFESLSFKSIISGVVNTIACSHRKAIDYYIESVNSICKFRSFKSESFADFVRGEHSKDFVCMGYHAHDFAKIQGQFFLSIEFSIPDCFI